MTTRGEGHDYVCPEPRCDFRSVGWPTEQRAAARGAQHAEEHDSGEPAPELAVSGLLEEV